MIYKKDDYLQSIHKIKEKVQSMVHFTIPPLLKLANKMSLHIIITYVVPQKELSPVYTDSIIEIALLPFW